MKEEEKSNTKKRVCLYMPLNIDKSLKKIVANKKKSGEKISKNKLSLMIIEDYINQNSIKGGI